MSETEPHMIPLGEDEVRFNAGVRCDMKKGPCACGAWHDPAQDEPFTSVDTKEKHDG